MEKIDGRKSQDPFPEPSMITRSCDSSTVLIPGTFLHFPSLYHNTSLNPYLFSSVTCPPMNEGEVSSYILKFDSCIMVAVPVSFLTPFLVVPALSLTSDSSMKELSLESCSSQDITCIH